MANNKPQSIKNANLTLRKFIQGRPSSKAVENILNERGTAKGIALTESEIRAILTSDVTGLSDLYSPNVGEQVQSWRRWANVMPLEGNGNPLTFTALPEAQKLAEGVSYTGTEGVLEEAALSVQRIQAMAEYSDMLSFRGTGNAADIMAQGLIRSLDKQVEKFAFDFYAGSPATAFAASDVVAAALEYNNPTIVSSKAADLIAAAKEAELCGFAFNYALVNDATVGGTIVAENSALKIGAYGPMYLFENSIEKADEGINIVKASCRIAGVAPQVEEVTTFALSA